ncbi:MAG TPA: Maf family protein [Candidatus Baltobacteraceae bacterium]|nr:Maf family protein [Candidatus Baltobacteraceae bacterium]
MSNAPLIILASASPRRLELLRSLSFEIDVVPSHYDEPEHPHLAPRDLAILHARHKCQDVRRRLSAGERASIPAADTLLVAADTVVDVDGAAYNKPADVRDAKRMLRDLSGRTHIVHTAFALAVADRSELIEHCESTFVTFFPLSEEEIDAYAASGEPMDKAGAYGIQGYGATLVERVEGDFYTVMGFPLARFVRTLYRLGISLPITNASA